MTAHKRNVVDHRMLKARQTPGGSGNGNGNDNGRVDRPTENAAGEPDIGGDGDGNSSVSVPAVSNPVTSPAPASISEKPTHSASAPSVPPSSSVPSSSSPVRPVTTQASSISSTSSTVPTSSTSAPSESSSAASSSSASSSSASSTSVSSSSTSTQSTSSVTPAPVAAATTSRRLQTSSFASVSRTILDNGSTISASALPGTTSGALGTGAIVGSVVGGIAGLAIVGFIIMFFLRHWRKRSRRSVFYPTDFRRSTAFPSDTPTASEFPPMAQRGHTVAPSVSGPGLAGMGVSGYGAVDASTPAADASAAAAKQALQERPKYTYGQGYPTYGTQAASHQEPALDDHDSDIAHGAYSSQPMVQTAYNPEAYGSYATYENSSGAEYQDVQREYQGQHGYQGYNQNAYYDQQQQQGSYDFVVAGAPPVPPAAGHAPVQVRDANGVGSSKRGTNTRSIVNDDDVYGGI